MNKSARILFHLPVCSVLLLSTATVFAEVAVQGLMPDATVNRNGVEKKVVVVAGILPAETEEKAAKTWTLHAEQWELARSGETILSMPVLKQVIKAWLAEKQKKIEIRYPGGEDGEFWVQELTDWLVSLGIPSKYMVTTPGSGADDVIKFNIIK